LSAHHSLLCAGFGCLAVALGCTQDFNGYHLESVGNGGAAATSGGDVGVGSGNASGGDESSAGEASTNGGRAGDSAGTAGGGRSSGSGGTAGIAGASVGEAGAHGEIPIVQPSCVGLEMTCGADGSASCCAASLVSGGSYDRSNLKAAPATVGDFTLEDYEVTVGRFRNFVNAFSRTMIPAGTGKNPRDPNDSGWNTAWNAALPATPADLVSALNCGGGSSFTAAPGTNEDLPVTCVNWFEAYAFCAWDGGRLPTEAEWNYAAAGGAEERSYPWGSTAPTDGDAVFCPGSCSTLQKVGSRVAGNGKWGQADLVGNAWEWNADVYAAYAATCTDCTNGSASTSALRVFRGGSAGNDATYLLSASRYRRDPNAHSGFVGLRCAR